MAAPVLGIDLGTTNSVVALHDGRNSTVIADADGVKLIPSVVSFHPNGEVLVGRRARQRRLIDAESTIYSVKRLIGRPFRSEEVRRARDRFPFQLEEAPTGGVVVSVRGETHTLAEISAFVLREVRQVAERSVGGTCNRAVITVPANFNELQRNATRAAGRIAGLEVLRILNEPTAAALAYGYGRGSRERIAVFDLGGGTFDLTILELSGEVFEVLATAGDTYLGGDDIDELLADQMAKAFLKHHRYDAKANRQAYERLRVAAEETKCRLTDVEETKLRVEELAFGEGGVSLDLAFGLKRKNLETMAQPLIARCFDVCEEAMRVAGIRPTQLDNIVLVGGATRMPLVKRMVAEYFGKSPLDSIDPDLVVAQGAAIQGHALSGAHQPRPVGRVQLKRLTETELELAKAAEEETTRARRPPPGSLKPRTRTAPLPGTAVPPIDEEGGDTRDERASELDEVSTVVEDGAAGAAGAASSRGQRESPRALRGKTSKLGSAATPERAPVGRGTLTQGGAAQAGGGGPPPVPPGATSEAPGRAAARSKVPEPPPDRPDESSTTVRTAPLVTVAGVAEPPTVPKASPVVPPAAPPVVPPAAPPLAPSVAPTGTHQPADAGSAEDMAEFDLPSIPPPSMPAPPPSGQASASSGPSGTGAQVPPPAPVPVPAGPSTPPLSQDAAPAPQMPLLLDVTPLTLAVETVSGFCEAVIPRNAAIPAEQTRIFSTAADNQEQVHVRICQGESRRLEENQGLGEVQLLGLRPAVRGQVQIAVSFALSADGTLSVTATDLATGQAQGTQVELVGALSEDDIERMRAKQQAQFPKG